MENVEGSMRCKYCQYFYDMNKEWIDFVHKKEEKEDAVQIISEKFSETGGRRPGSGRNSKKAIELTKIDFGVIYGVRSLEEQEKLLIRADPRL